jgi:hypothetical protein
MATVKVEAPKVSRSIEFEYDFGSSLKEMLELFGEEVVYEHAFDNMMIACQAATRAKLQRGIGDDGKRDAKKYMSDRAILEEMKKWKPSVRKAADPAKVKADLVKRMSRLDEAEKAALIEELKRSMNAA